MSTVSLRSLQVLVTRPLAQQAELASAIEQQGGGVVSLPLLAIEALADGELSRDTNEGIRHLDRFDVLIFISGNAARIGGTRIKAFWPRLPLGITLIAVGPGTAQALESMLDAPVIHSPSGMNSEVILQLPELQRVTGKRIGIVRGLGGRALLGDTLRARGAELCYLEVYARRPIDYPPGHLGQLLDREGIDVLTVSSGESLQRLVKLAGDQLARFLALPLVVPSARIGRQAERIGFTSVKEAGGADTASTLAVLQELAQQADNQDNG